MGHWVLEAPNPIHVTVGWPETQGLSGLNEWQFSVWQQQDLTIWSVDSFTALIAKWGSRPRQVDTDVDVRMGFSFSSGLSTKQSRLEVSKAKLQAAANL